MSEYGAGQISILKGLEAVKKRPGMYVGDVTTVAATHHLLYEIFDNSVDEALAGHARNISVTLHADGSATVSDDGRGIPVAYTRRRASPPPRWCSPPFTRAGSSTTTPTRSPAASTASGAPVRTP